MLTYMCFLLRTERNGLLENLTSKTAGFYHLGNFDSAQVLNTDRFYYVAGWEEIETEKALCSVHLSALIAKLKHQRNGWLRNISKNIRTKKNAQEFQKQFLRIMVSRNRANISGQIFISKAA